MRIPFASNELPATEHAGARGYVRTAVFDDIESVFDAEKIWARARFLSDANRLRGFVGDNRVALGRRSYVHASVELLLPEIAVRDDIWVADGASCRALETELAALHARDFGSLLPAGETPRYSVKAGKDLAPTQVRARVGHAIHVPASDEEIAWHVHASRDGLWGAAQTVMLAERQRVCLLGGDIQTASATVEGWPFLGAALVLINQPGKDGLVLEAEPLRSLKLTWRAELDCYEVRSGLAPADAGAVLYLRAVRQTPVTVPAVPAKPVAGSPRMPPLRDPAPTEARRRDPGALPLAEAAPPRPEAPATAPDAAPDHGTWLAQPTEAEADPDANRTLLADAAPLATPMARLELAGLAVLRPSRFRSHGLRALRWGLDERGNVVAPHDGAAWLRFTVDADDQLRVSGRDGDAAFVVGQKLPLPLGEAGDVVQLRALPAPLDALYLGWIPLPSRLAVDLPAGAALDVGRDMEPLARIRPLAGDGFVAAAGSIGGGDQVGLSRRHFTVRAGPDGLAVQALGVNSLEHLDADMGHLRTIGEGAPDVVADGQHLVVGHYVWRFRAVAA
jgi:hypothetical protein